MSEAEPVWPPERLQREILFGLSSWLRDQQDAAHAVPGARDGILARAVDDLTDCYQLGKTATRADRASELREMAYILLERPLRLCGVRSLPLILRSASRGALRRLKAPEALASLATAHTSLPATIAKLDAILTGQEREHYCSTGVRDLDDLLFGGLPKGEMTLLGADSGHGKTTLALQIAWTVANRQPDQIVYVCSPEMKSADLWFRIAQKECRVSRWDLKRNKPGAAEAMMACISRQSQQSNLVLLDRTDAGIVEAIDGALLTHGSRGALSLVVLDYAQELTGDTAGTKPRYLEVGAVAVGAVKLAAETGAAVLLTSQINVAKDKEGKIVDESFRESKILRHKSALALLMRPDWEAFRMTVKVDKARHGPHGQVELYYQPEWYLLGDLERA
jgi:replicative DNA helicase